jgi:hypothetical protein
MLVAFGRMLLSWKAGISLRTTTIRPVWDGLIRELDAEQRRQEELANDALAKFKSNISKVIEVGAGNRINALRWMTSTETFYGKQSVEYWVYKQGILFTSEGRELVEELMNIVKFEDD